MCVLPLLSLLAKSMLQEEQPLTFPVLTEPIISHEYAQIAISFPVTASGGTPPLLVDRYDTGMTPCLAPSLDPHVLADAPLPLPVSLVTVRTKAGRHSFGTLRDRGLILSDIGRIVMQYWQDIPHTRQNVYLDAWIMTPEQLHGIVILRPTVQLPDLGIIMNQFKGACTRHIHAAGFGGFAWQEGFYARSLGTERALLHVRRSFAMNDVLHGKRWENV